MGVKEVNIRTETIGKEIYHHVKGLPNFTELNSKVKEAVKRSSYWERHGKDLTEIGLAFPLHLVSSR